MNQIPNPRGGIPGQPNLDIHLEKVLDVRAIPQNRMIPLSIGGRTVTVRLPEPLESGRPCCYQSLGWTGPQGQRGNLYVTFHLTNSVPVPPVRPVVPAPSVQPAQKNNTGLIVGVAAAVLAVILIVGLWVIPMLSGNSQTTSVQNPPAATQPDSAEGYYQSSETEMHDSFILDIEHFQSLYSDKVFHFYYSFENDSTIIITSDDDLSDYLLKETYNVSAIYKDGSVILTPKDDAEPGFSIFEAEHKEGIAAFQVTLWCGDRERSMLPENEMISILACGDEDFYTNPVLAKTSIPASTVRSITFLPSLEQAPVNAWDYSTKGNGKVLMWMESNSGMNDMYIAGENGVSASYDFYGFSCFTNVESIVFNDCFNTSNCFDADGMFSDCSQLRELDLSCFDTSRMDSMAGMFMNCTNLKSINLTSFDTTNVEIMSMMFQDCGVEMLDLSGFDTSNVTSMFQMFTGCSAHTINVSGFDTSKVTSMHLMFSGCHNLTGLDISHFDYSCIDGDQHMFGW